MRSVRFVEADGDPVTAWGRQSDEVRRLAEWIQGREEVRITAPGGTDITLNVSGRKVQSELEWWEAHRERVRATGEDLPESYLAFVDRMLSATPFEVVAEFFPGFGSLDKFAAVEVLAKVPTAVIGGTALLP